MKKILSFIVLVLVISSTSIPAFAQGSTKFKDVSSNHRFVNQINFLVDQGVINGFYDGTFKPNDNLNLVQILTMLFKAKGITPSTNAPDPYFADISKGDKHYNMFATAAELRIIPSGGKGYDFSIRPYEPITRGQMARYISMTYNISRSWEGREFKDLSFPSPNYFYAETLAAYNITQGYEDNTFRPYEKITRGQFSAFMYNLMNISDSLKNREFTYSNYDTELEFDGLIVKISKPTNSERDGRTETKFHYSIKNISDSPRTFGAFKVHYDKGLYLGNAPSSTRRLAPNEEVIDTASGLIPTIDIPLYGKPYMIEYSTNSDELQWFVEPLTNSLKWEVND